MPTVAERRVTVWQDKITSNIKVVGRQWPTGRLSAWGSRIGVA
jgi:hypothetical protein